MPARLNERQCGYCHSVKPMTAYLSRMSYVCLGCQSLYDFQNREHLRKIRRKEHGGDWMGKKSRSGITYDQ